ASKADVTTKVVELALLPSPSEVPLVHVSGTARQAFSQAEMDSIKTYADAGGILLFENAGGRGEFANAATEMLRKLYPDRRIKPIGLQTAVITGKNVGGL